MRPDPAEGDYETVAGHRRFRTCELAGLDAMPVIVRCMSDEEAVAELVCSNIQRENVFPSASGRTRCTWRPRKNLPGVQQKIRRKLRQIYGATMKW